MSFYALSALVNGIAATALGMFVYSRAPQSATHRSYGLFCLSVAFWSYSYLAWQLADSKDLAFACVRFLTAGSIAIPIFYFHHVLSILNLVERHRFQLRAGYLLGGLFLLIDFTPLMVADLQPAMSFRYWPKAGPIFHVYLVWFLVYAYYAIHLIAISYRTERGSRRNQYLYLLVASLIGYAGGVTNFPLWYGIQIPPDRTILVAVYTAIVAYTIMRYRLMDISVAMEKGLNYLLLSIIVLVPFYAVLLVAQETYFGMIS